jgi:transcriptional regulator with XRE-family HTH domain
MTKRSHLGRMFALYRAAENLTLRDLAPQIGISAATLLRIEQGKATDVVTFLQLWAWLLGPEAGAARVTPPQEAAPK